MFVQHYLIKMFDPSQTFLDQRMADQQSDSSDAAEGSQRIGANQKTVRELSRFASYLGGNSPPAPQKDATHG
jgi:hypothetical protein